MEGLFQSVLTGRQYYFKHFTNEGAAVLARGVVDGQDYRVPLDNIAPSAIERIRLTEEGEQVPVAELTPANA